MFPRDMLFYVSKATHMISSFTISLSPSNVWEGMLPCGQLASGTFPDKPSHWDCSYWRTVDKNSRAYFYNRVENIGDSQRSKLPFFVIFAKPKTSVSENSGIDLTNQLRWFAWKGNRIGGIAFWRWFLMQFGGGLNIDDCELTVISSETFSSSVLDPTTVMVL